MRVVQITTSLNGGAGIAALRLHQGYKKYIADVDSSIIQKFPLETTTPDIYQCTHFHNYYYRIVNKLSLKNLLTKEGNITREIEKYPKDYEIVTIPFSYYPIENHPIIKEADIIHLHWVGHFLNYPSFFKKIQKPIVWTLHDMNPFMGLFHYEGDVNNNELSLGNLDKKITAYKTKAIHQNSNINIVCLCEWMKNKSIHSQTFKNYPHYIIPNGLDILDYPQINRKEAKEVIDVNNGKKTILCIADGLSVYRKGIDILIDSIKLLNNTDINLILVGEGEFPVKEGISYIRYNKIKDNQLLNQIYSAADLTIIPSREDNLPNVMLESFINGTPVMSFSNGGMAEHIQTGKNGILIENISPKDLAIELNKFIDDEYNLDQSEKIRDYAIENFNIEIQAKNYLKLYKHLLSR